MRAVVLTVVLLVAGCSLFKTIVRSVNDIATDLCWVYAEEHGLPASYCAVKENVDPFVDYILRATRDGVPDAD